MDLPFTTAEFFNVFGRYNQAIFPLQFVFLGAALMAVFAVWSRTRNWSRPVLLLLAVLWLWMGIVYHFMHFRSINPAAAIFALLFIAQATLLAVTAVRRPGEIRPTWNLAGISGAAVIAYSLAVYPALGHMLGHRYPFSPTFGAPCPTTLYTIGMLLWMRPIRISLLGIPMLWALIATTAAFKLGVLEDIALIIAAVITLALYGRERLGHVHAAQPAD